MTKVSTHLMFAGSAEEAMNFYVGLIPDSEILSLQHYVEGNIKGKVHQARFKLAGHEYICIDSPVKHEFGFTPAISIFVDFDNIEKLESVFAALSIDASIYMPLDNYGFSKKFAWLSDRFGVSWQLNFS